LIRLALAQVVQDKPCKTTRKGEKKSSSSKRKKPALPSKGIAFAKQEGKTHKYGQVGF
jgi:hypothetical protein